MVKAPPAAWNISATFPELFITGDSEVAEVKFPQFKDFRRQCCYMGGRGGNGGNEKPREFKDIERLITCLPTNFLSPYDSQEECKKAHDFVLENHSSFC